MPVESNDDWWNAQYASVPAVWMLLSRESRKGDWVLEADPRSWWGYSNEVVDEAVGGREAQRRRKTTKEVASQAIACPQSRPAIASLPSGMPREREEEVAMTTEVEGMGD